jgi:hypothetical protein
VLLPDPLHRRGTDYLRRRHRADAPLRGVFRSRLGRGFDDRGFPLGGDPLGSPTSWTVFKNPGDTSLSSRFRQGRRLYNEETSLMRVAPR